jgi:DNA polymerase (family 10)
LSLSEYGIKNTVKNDGKIEEFADEESCYKRVGLPYIPPEIRHGVDEVGLASQGKLPKLLELSDIKGDVHTHTTASDGVNTLKEMVDYAKNKKYKFIGIADHAPSVLSRGLEEVKRIVNARRKEIEQINSSQDDIRVLFGYEVNILTDATLALPDEILKQLDYAIASIHASFDQDRETVTNRMLAAIENPYIKIIGHPSGRLINEREGCDLDWTKIFKAAAENGKTLEINSQPQRLDLADDLVREAIRCKVKLIINTDAHETSSLDLMRYGVDVARRGMATKENIINTQNVEDFLKSLE